MSDQGIINTPLLQFLFYAYRTIALVYPRMDIHFGKAIVTLQVFFNKRLYNAFYRGIIIAAQGKLVEEFFRAVFAPRQEPDRAITDVRQIVAQASASSGLSVRLISGKTLLRIVASISLAISGFSLRNTLTFSLPWPIRSPL